MPNTSNETSDSAIVDSKQACAECAEPTPVDDLERRIKILRESGCRAYKDGKLEIVFAPSPKTTLTMAEMALAERAQADAAR